MPKIFYTERDIDDMKARGVTKAALYYHYRSKEELLTSIVEPVMADMTAVLDRVDEAVGPADLDPESKRQLLEDYLDVLLKHRRVCDMFARDAASMAAMALRRSFTGTLSAHDDATGQKSPRRLRPRRGSPALSVAHRSASHTRSSGAFRVAAFSLHLAERAARKPTTSSVLNRRPVSAPSVS
mgnify:CR=1 FL=1